MVGSKNCDDHRNHGGGLVEIEFKAVRRMNSLLGHRALARIC